MGVKLLTASNLNNSSAHSIWLAITAECKHVFPFESISLGLTPAFNKAWTQTKCPWIVAKWIGVKPLLFLSSTDTPFLIGLLQNGLTPY